MHNESPKVIECLTGREGAMSTLMGEDPMTSQDASHPKSIRVPTEEPFQCVNARQVRRYVRGQCLVRNVDASSRQGGVTSDKVH
mmetsp:Transcript_5757/g.9618  ORF Transcript_5757/g.9618 Transcript_5757/m.9618 type:complete len:84 (-) Transcript_5757:230-481(-)